MLPHTFSDDCWCGPLLHPSGVMLHRHLLLTCDHTPRAMARLSEGIPV